jgi:hypothetical protein
VTLWNAGPSSGSVFADAWQLSRTFWTQTLTAWAQHFVIVLLYAAPPATYRAWVILREKSVPAWWLPALEALIAVWRFLMIALAIWIVLTPAELATLRAAVTSNDQFQDILYHLRQAVGGQTWLLAWEIVFFLLAFLFIAWLLSLMARLWVQGTDLDRERKIIQCKALSAAARNLLLVPVAMIYVVVAIRFALR